MQYFTYGNTLSFQVAFSGPGLSNDPSADSGTSFLFVPFGPGPNLVLANSYAPGLFELDFNPDGTQNLIDYSSSPGILSVTTPEPAQWLPLAAALAALFAWSGRRARRPLAALAVLCMLAMPALRAQSGLRGTYRPKSKSNPRGDITSGYTGPVPYHGGALVANPSYHMIYWGAYWGSGYGLTQRSYVNNFVQTVGTSSAFASLLSEYSVPGYTIGQGVFAGEKLVTPGPPASVSDADIRNQIAAWIANSTLPVPDANTVYVLMFPPAVNAANACGSIYGYHNDATSPNGHYRYIVIPYLDCGTETATQGPVAIDALTQVLEHEFAENQTDPDINPLGWVDTSGGDYNEIGDICSYVSANVGYQGFLLQKLWSNAAADCVAPIAGDSSIHLTISTGGSTPSGVANLLPGAPTAFNITTDSTTPVNLSLSGLPAGVSYTLSQPTVSSTSPATLQLSTGSSPGPRAFPTLTAIRGAQSAQFQFLVDPWKQVTPARVTSTGFVYNYNFDRPGVNNYIYTGRLILTNTGSSPIGPTLLVAFHNLDASITPLYFEGNLDSPAGTSPLGDPVLRFPDGILQPGQSVTVPVAFENPNVLRINFTPIVYEVQ
ncbi:MAG TPA: hypothetical protein VKX45_13500 [Bryobacteraceae bacterium]|jgi:hypothetical protein|nr:hypothetical protein [Bryobacteraceae bacterium]